jgi:hypothetical protein
MLYVKTIVPLTYIYSTIYFFYLTALTLLKSSFPNIRKFYVERTVDGQPETVPGGR